MPTVKLCGPIFAKGPHLPDTGWIKAIKLLSVAGAYWRGDETKAQLQRIYATAFWSQSDLDAYLTQREEAEKRDHRRLAKELSLFSICDEIGPGLVLWHPALSTVREELETFLKGKLKRGGYQSVYTPHLAKRDLWEISGHTSHYLDNMFSMDIEGQPYILKPMNCPMHTMIFKSDLHSYRDLPIRISEFGTVYRYEKSGVMHGLNRVRGFTQDDAHVFCRPDQIKDEILTLIRLVESVFAQFGMAFSQVELSTRPDKLRGRACRLGAGRNRANGGTRRLRPVLRDQCRGRGVLRPQNRFQGAGCHWPHMAVFYDSARL